MSLDELIRDALSSEAVQASPIDDLLDASIRRGRHKRVVRRTTIAIGGLAAAGMLSVGVLALTGPGSSRPDNELTVGPADGGSSSTSPTAAGAPWWDSWNPGRHDGPVDETFLTNARPNYGSGPEPIAVYATGTEPDGTDWVMYTDPADGNKVQWLQGWNGQPNFGFGHQRVDDAMTWTSFASPTLAAQNTGQLQQWLIVVGRPGTTEIDYSSDGNSFSPLDVQDGIAVTKIDGGIPETARVRLSDAGGVYATGTPNGAASDQPRITTSPSEGAGTSSPTPSPGGATAPTTAASSSGRR